jgi:FAD/FMN-containing dehydrogenase
LFDDGSAEYGTVAESVLGLEVALSDGRLVPTGSRANRGGKPFFRHYGPDLTGVFLSDTGALGLKVEATIRLIRAPQFTEYASFSFADFYDLAKAQTEIGRAGLTAECFGLDPYLNGKRWIPIHACLPASKLVPVYEATIAYFKSKQDVLDKYKINTSHLTGSSGTDIVFEPAFYYPDALKTFHLRNLEPADAEKYKDLPAVPGATDAVIGMLGDLAEIFIEHGAVNQQIGKFYPYKDAMAADTWSLLEDIKRSVDPDGLMNPGSLGLE